MRRWLIRLLIAGVVVLSGLAIAMRGYLQSDQAIAQVAAKLQSILNLPVKVSGLDVGIGQSSISGLSVFESGDSLTAEPWIKIETATADVGLMQLLDNEVSASSLDFSGATVLLRFDREGQLLTKLPPSRELPVVPPIHFEKS